MGQDVCLIRSREHNQRFLVYLLRSPAVMGQLEAQMIGATFKRINVVQIKSLVVCVPPKTEQDEIADYCDSMSEGTSRLRAKVQAGADTLREYRTTLISAAVTGKIDVREV